MYETSKPRKFISGITVANVFTDSSLIKAGSPADPSKTNIQLMLALFTINYAVKK
jgi:hypothetical protein